MMTPFGTGGDLLRVSVASLKERQRNLLLPLENSLATSVTHNGLRST